MPLLDRWRAGTVVSVARAWTLGNSATGVRVDLAWKPPSALDGAFIPGVVEVQMAHPRFGSVATAIMTTPRDLEDAKRYVRVRMDRLLSGLILKDTYREECVGHKDRGFN